MAEGTPLQLVILLGGAVAAVLAIKYSIQSDVTQVRNFDTDFLPPASVGKDSNTKKRPKSLSTVFQQLCRENITGCCREETDLKRLDWLSMALAEFQVTKSRNHTRYNDIPSYRRPALNCSGYPERFRAATPPRFAIRTKKPFPTVFSGNILSIPRHIVDFVMVSYELDTLEARLHEYQGIVDYFAIFESGYNHRGWRKKRFLQEELQKSDGRFAPFEDQILYFDIDNCDEYSAEIEKERYNGTAKSAGKDVWDIQNTLRSCRWKLFQQTHIYETLPNETLVICGDLDWLPDAGLLHHIKNCEPTPEYGMKAPFHLTLNYLVMASLRLGCYQAYNTVPMFLHTLGRIQDLGGLPGGTGSIDQGMNREINEEYTIPFYCSGLHLQDLGSLANLLYRDVTHAEFAGFREEHLLEGHEYCDITDDFLAKKQYHLSTQPKSVYWRIAGRAAKRDFQDSIALQQPTTKELNTLRECYVPWVFLEHWSSFPFAWGYGEYAMYNDMD